MFHTVTRWTGMVSVAAAIAFGPSLTAQTSSSDAALKARSKAPKATEIDKTATLDSLLSKSTAADWSSTKGASLEGYVIQLVKSEDGDMRLYLAARPDETDSLKWVIVEVKPKWMKKVPGLAPAKLWQLGGKKIRASGWLFFDTPAVKFPRGTSWEIHPVTEIVPIS